MPDADESVASRAELDALRARAYGPTPSLDDAGYRRLQQLEDAATGSADDSDAHDAPTPDRPIARTPPRRMRGQVALVALVAVAAAALGGIHVLQSAPESAMLSGEPTTGPMAALDAEEVRSAPGTEVLLRVPIDGSFGTYVDLPDSRVPPFPTDELRWTQLMGDFYGWRIWIGRGTTDDACLVAQRGERTRARCVTDEAHHRGELLVALSLDEIEVDERPPGMRADHAVAFLWSPGDDLTVLRADVSAVLEL